MDGEPGFFIERAGVFVERAEFFIERAGFFIKTVTLGNKLKMGIGLALLGVALGAAGTELLRAKRPDIVEKIEDAARNFVDSVFLSKEEK